MAKKVRKDKVAAGADTEGLTRFAGMARPSRYGYPDPEVLDTTPIVTGKQGGC